ncbi:MAG: FAD-dependent monooxygenase [Exiguobacterium chiriqhucha]|jgi:2-polyprenyl-6-methoxyphenol hydroxylase-like FAD-dependent oxidoreductase|uniref:FAD-dependent monooxygenase n=1 Tax=Exiguobacterium sp. s26 TaxID=2751231 RepID=UPI001BE4FCF6|nr:MULTISPECIES: FAD-dependent monooxygenase [unclassified Exiguobacterium]
MVDVVDKQVDVLIVGAGPTGLTLALTLARYGISFEIIDRKTTPSNNSRAIGIQPRTIEVFSRLDVAKEVLDRARTIEKGNLYFSGQWTAKLEFSRLVTPYPFVTLLRQNETEAILEAALNEHGHYVQRGEALVSLTHYPSRVLAHLESDSNRTIEAKYVVAADGANSSIRRMLALPFSGKSFKESWVLADMKAKWNISREEVHIFFSDRGVLEVFPLTDDTIRITGNLASDESFSEAELRELIEQRSHMDVEIDEVEWFSLFRVHNRMVDSFIHNRVILMGDAAHINSPVGGQGMNTGIADSFNLGWKLWLHLKAGAPFRVVDSYRDEREHVARNVLQTTNVATEVLQTTLPVLLPFQALGADVFTRVNLINQKITERIAQLHLSYPGHSRVPFLRVTEGKIFPEIEIIRTDDGLRTKISEVADGRFQVLVLDDDKRDASALYDYLNDHQSFFQIITLSKTSRPFFDQGNELAKSLFMKRGVLVIRPDGYLLHKQRHLRPEALQATMAAWLPSP